jgi:hypothetical protein
VIREFTEVLINYKAGFGALGFTSAAWWLDKMQWFDANLAKVSMYAALALTLITAISYICSIIRQNSIQKQDSKLKDAELRLKDMDLEIREDEKRELELRVQLLEIELESKKHDNNK